MNRSVLWVCTMVLGACGAPLSGPPRASLMHTPTAFEYDDLINQARKNLTMGATGPAIDVLTRASLLDQKRPEAFGLWGRALAMQGQLKHSAAKYERALSLGSQNRRIFAELASVYDISKNYPKAINVYRAYLERHPKDADFAHQLGLTLLLNQQAAEAIIALQRATTHNPQSERMATDLGYALLVAKQPRAASDILQPLHSPTARRFLARAYAAQGMTHAALTTLDALLHNATLNPDATALRMRAQLRSLTGHHEGAVADYQRLLQQDPSDAGAILGACGAWIALGRLDDADRVLSAQALPQKALPAVAFRRAQIDWRRGKHEAIKVIEDYAMRHLNLLEAWRELEYAAQKLGDKKRMLSASRHRLTLESRHGPTDGSAPKQHH